MKHAFHQQFRLLLFMGFVLAAPISTRAQAARRTSPYRFLKSYLKSFPAIDTHDHLSPFDHLPTYAQTDRGFGMTLWGLLVAHYGWINPLPPWNPGESFDEWWGRAKPGFQNARATSFYREMLPAFRDLYGVDFNQITDEQARNLNTRIFANYKSDKWLSHAITESTNIELMFIDPYWARLDFRTAYRFGILVFNVTSLVWGFSPLRVSTKLPSYVVL